MGKYTFDDFKAGRIGIRCDTREEYDKLMRMCEAKGIKWCTNNRATDWDCLCRGPKPTFPCQIACIIKFNGNAALYWRPTDRDLDKFIPSVPFSTLFPADPWADFIAGKCYLRVTKAEWAEFAKRCEAAGIEWQYGVGSVSSYEASFRPDAFVCMNGRHDKDRGIFQSLGLKPSGTNKPIHPFSAVAPEPVKADRPKPEQSATSPRKYKVGDLFEMTAHHNSLSPGDVVKLVYDDGSDRKHYARLTDGLMQWVCDNELKPYRPEQKIIITTDGHTTTAKLIDGKQTIKTATARCNEGDKFDFEVGASISMNRLIHGKDFPNASPDHFAAWEKQLRALADEVAKASE